MAEESPKPQSWWQTLPGVLTAVATIITAATGLIVALNQAGCFPPRPNPNPPGPTQTTAVSTDTSPRTATGVDELEQKLGAANIKLSTGGVEDRSRVRGYFTGPTSPYHLLAVSCLEIMGNQRLKRIGYLDMIDKHYTLLVGENNYASADGKLNLEKVKEAMVIAQNELYGDNPTSFEQIVESR
jgi:hypothetical protein